jgi:hypothetical protein
MTAKTKPDAEALRQAASEIRDDCNVATRSVRPFLIAVADFLDESRDAFVAGACNFEMCDEPGAIKTALTIARAYLGDGAK